MRASKARTGHSTGCACHKRWSAYGTSREYREAPSITRGGSRMPELGPYGSMRGARGNSRPYRDQRWILACDGLSASLIGRSGSSAFKPSITTFQTIHHCSVDVAHGLVLLFGIGIRGPSTMGFENEAEQSNGRPYRQIDDMSKRTNELTSSIVPRGTSFHRSVELGFSPIACDPVRFSCCCRGLFPGPAELGAVNPYAVHDHGQPAGQRHDCLFLPAASGDLQRPGLEPRPFIRTEHALSCFVEHDPHHLISAA